MTNFTIPTLFRFDSYKGGHFLMNNPEVTSMRSYIEARGGDYNETVFFGLQALIKSALLEPITYEQVQLKRQMAAMHGIPFNYEGWIDIVREFGGHLPITIEAAPEGTVMSPSNVQLQVVNNGGDSMKWVTSWAETMLLRGVWYPSNTATISREMKKRIYQSLLESSDDPDSEIEYKLHDFGARGATCSEAAMLGGMGHLVNFRGTDTFEAIYGARMLYNEPMAGESIPASEHATVTSWGREGESDMVGNLLSKFPTGMVSNVGDTYDIFNHVGNILGETYREAILSRDGVYIIRPDSGNPLTMVLDVIELAMQKFGHTVNSKGYRVLPPQVRAIQGDGMTVNTIPLLLANALDRGISTSNFAMGMGGGLLQKHDRDTMKYAMKNNDIEIDGKWVGVRKDPITDRGKRSKMGRQALISYNGEFQTVPHSSLVDTRTNQLRPVFRNGELLIDDDFSKIRERAKI